MIRKSMLALAAVATLGTVALAPTSASAWGYKGWGWGFGHHHHFHGHYGHYGFYAPRVVIGGDCYFVKRVNRHGYVRLIKVCD